jgi:hypothetical protein
MTNTMRIGIGIMVFAIMLFCSLTITPILLSRLQGSTSEVMEKLQPILSMLPAFASIGVSSLSIIILSQIHKWR